MVRFGDQPTVTTQWSQRHSLTSLPLLVLFLLILFSLLSIYYFVYIFSIIMLFFYPAVCYPPPGSLLVLVLVLVEIVSYLFISLQTHNSRGSNADGWFLLFSFSFQFFSSLSLLVSFFSLSFYWLMLCIISTLFFWSSHCLADCVSFKMPFFGKGGNCYYGLLSLGVKLFHTIRMLYMYMQ